MCQSERTEGQQRKVINVGPDARELYPDFTYQVLPPAGDGSSCGAGESGEEGVGPLDWENGETSPGIDGAGVFRRPSRSSAFGISMARTYSGER